MTLMRNSSIYLLDREELCSLLSVELRQYVLILLTVHCFCNFNIEVINYDWHMRKCESYSRLITACPSSFEFILYVACFMCV
jgi:hypothetical protein